MPFGDQEIPLLVRNPIRRIRRGEKTTGEIIRFLRSQRDLHRSLESLGAYDGECEDHGRAARDVNEGIDRVPTRGLSGRSWCSLAACGRIIHFGCRFVGVWISFFIRSSATSRDFSNAARIDLYPSLLWDTGLRLFDTGRSGSCGRWLPRGMRFLPHGMRM